MPRDADVGEAARCSVDVRPATVTVAELEVADVKLASPVKVAVTAFDPTGRVEVFSTAVPLFSVAVPRMPPPLAKVTVLPLEEVLPLVYGVSVADRATCVPSDTEAGDAVRYSADAMPEPLSATVVMGALALVVMLSVPVTEAADVAVKLTVMVQDAPAATEPPQVLVWVKPLPATMDAMVSGPVEVLVRFNGCVVGVLRCSAPKLMEVGLTVGAGGAEMVTDVALEVTEAKLASPVKVAVMEFDPSGRLVRLSVATPLVSVPVPSVAPPLVKVTVLPLVESVPAL